MAANKTETVTVALIGAAGTVETVEVTRSFPVDTNPRTAAARKAAFRAVARETFGARVEKGQRVVVDGIGFTPSALR